MNLYKDKKAKTIPFDVQRLEKNLHNKISIQVILAI